LFNGHLKLTLDLIRQHDGNNRLPTEGSFWPSIMILNENSSPLLVLYHTNIILVLLRTVRFIDI